MCPFIKQFQISVVLFVLEFNFYHFYDFSFAVSCHLLQQSVCHHELIYCIFQSLSLQLTTLVGKQDNHINCSYVQSRPSFRRRNSISQEVTAWILMKQIWGISSDSSKNSCVYFISFQLFHKGSMDRI